MGREMTDSDIKILSGLWQELILSGKLNICTGSLADVTPLDVNILRVVGTKPEIILREICSVLNVPSSTLTSAINRLTKRGLLKRMISERDLRSFGLELTDAGRAALEEHNVEEKKIICKMLTAFENQQEKDEFIRLFGKLVKSTLEIQQKE